MGAPYNGPPPQVPLASAAPRSIWSSYSRDPLANPNAYLRPTKPGKRLEFRGVVQPGVPPNPVAPTYVESSAQPYDPSVDIAYVAFRANSAGLVGGGSLCRCFLAGNKHRCRHKRLTRAS